MKQYILLGFISLLFSAGCKKQKSSDTGSKNPVPVSLSLPKINEVCAIGVITQNESLINFAWNKNDDSDGFEVVVKNLKTNSTTTYPTSDTKLQLSLPVNTPFSWYVRSMLSKQVGSSQSEVWRFYTSGPGITSYAPFPADKLNPLQKEQVNATNGKVTLSWEGSHVENNIKGYDIYFGVSPNNTPLLKNDFTLSTVTVDVSANTTYYWKVITRDENGNQSDSGLYQFTVL